MTILQFVFTKINPYNCLFQEIKHKKINQNFVATLSFEKKNILRKFNEWNNITTSYVF